MQYFSEMTVFINLCQSVVVITPHHANYQILYTLQGRGHVCFVNNLI